MSGEAAVDIGNTKHGTTGGYKKGCRCEECSAARRQSSRKSRQRARANLVDRAAGIKHGNQYALDMGCRCEACLSYRHKQQAAARRRRRAARDAGVPIPEQAHGTAFGYQHYYCRCAPCSEAMNAARREQYLRNPEKTLRRNERALARQVAATLPHATRHRHQWTGPELEQALRTDLTVKELALHLGRSYYAVAHARAKARNDPKWRDVTGVAEDQR